MFKQRYSNKTVWISGHTGFKGSWLAHWLLELGARVHGFALAPGTTPALFDRLGLAQRLHQHQVADIRDAAAVSASIHAVQPDFVFHLAAQPIVVLAYERPVDTWTTNLIGTLNVLEALRSLDKPCAAVMITSDKCYENREWLYGYREDDALGGHDPYSSSKAAAEIAISSWRRSYFATLPVRLASARAGNVIGGGDWARARIVPDCMRALEAQQPIPVRNKVAIRPWQHVLEPLSGYLWLGAWLASESSNVQRSTLNAQPSIQNPTNPIIHQSIHPSFNFGPGHESNRTVEELVIEVLKHWPGHWEDHSDPGAVHEARLLQLATDKAHAVLGWAPVWAFPKAIEHTVTWYREAARLGSGAGAVEQLRALTTRQIVRYQAEAADAGVRWAL